MTHDREAYDEIVALMREGQYSAARDRLEAARETWPDDFWLKRQYADVLLRQGDTHKAGPLIADLLAIRPDHPRVLTLAAERHRLEGRLEEATAGFLESLKLSEDSYVRSRAIDGLLSLKRFPEAEDLILGGLRLNPHDPYLLRRKARLMASTARPDEAAQAYTAASKESTQASPRDYVEALKLKLKTLQPAEQLKEVERLLKVGTYRENPYLLALAAELAIDLEAPDRARISLDQAAALGAEDPHLLRMVGFLFNRLDAFDRVLDTLGIAFVHDPRDVISQQVLLAAAKKSDALGRLRTLFVRAYEKHPGFHKLNGLIKKVDNEMAARALKAGGSSGVLDNGR